MGEPTKKPLGERIADRLRFSMAAYVAFVVGCALVLLTLLVWAIYNANPQRIAWGDYIQLPQLLMLASLGLVICTITYWLVRLWCDDLPARDRDLEKAWQQGASAIRDCGMSLDQLPIFLVFGCTNTSIQDRLVKQSGCRLVASPVPADAVESPIRWYFAEDRILLFCSGLGAFGTAQRRLDLHLDQSPDGANGRNSRSNSSSRVLPIHSNTGQRILDSEASPNEPQGHGHGNDKSIQGSDPISRNAAAEALPSMVEVATASPPTKGEPEPLFVESLESLEEAERLIEALNQPDSTPMASRSGATRNRKPLLNSNEQVRLQTLLEDFCRRLRTGRGNVAAMNGILVWVDALQLDHVSRAANGTEIAHAYGQSLRRDLLQIQEELGIQVPISIFLDGMQAIPGFTELIRRVGPSGAQNQILGEPYALQSIPSVSSMQRASRQSVRAIGSMVYRLFRESSQKGQPGNHKLFRLLVACRSKLVRALGPLLVEGMVGDRDQVGNADGLLFNGVFFGGSGDQPIQQGFSKPVFEQMIEQQELLNWTASRLRQEQRYRTIVWCLQCFSAILALVMIVLLLRIAFPS